MKPSSTFGPPPFLSLLAFLPLLLGCNAFGAGGDDHIVEGVNLTRLFAAPTPADRAAVLSDWGGRDVGVHGYREVATAAVYLGDRTATLRIVSHTVDGVRHYGAILVPDDAAPSSLPVLVYAHGGDGGVNVDEALFVINGLPEMRDAFVYVIPSFRSEPLQVGGRRYLSEGPPSPWDYDVDDALALVNVALETTPAADEGRMGVVGFSRGGGVGLLMGVRDPRIDVVVEYFGPTDFYGSFIQQVFEEALQNRFRGLPGEDYLTETFVQPLKRKELSPEAVRLELLRRSAAQFAERLPQVQVHHGRRDDIVPVGQAEALIAAMQALGRTAPGFESFLYEGGVHNPLSLPGSFERTQAFLSRLFAPATAS